MAEKGRPIIAEDDCVCSLPEAHTDSLGSPIGGANACQPCPEIRRPFLRGPLGFFPQDQPEANRLARSQLSEQVQVRADDVGKLRIATDRLAIDAEHHGLAIVGNLDGTGSDRFGNEFSWLPHQRLTLEAKTHPVAGRRHRISLREEGVELEPEVVMSAVCSPE